MLLTRLVRYCHGLRDDERGVALAAVMGLMLVGMLVSALIIGSVVSGMGTTTSSRAGVQSEASAEAGVDVALSKVIGGTCSTTIASSISPVYTASVSYSTAANFSAVSWIPGCPTASAQWVKIVSKGTAAAAGVDGNTSGNAQSVEAIYNRPVASTSITATGPAVYSYSSSGFSGAGTLVSSDGTADANVFVTVGPTVSCSGGGGIQGSLVVKSGDLSLSGSCHIYGSIWDPTGTVNAGNNVVGGNLVANAATVASGSVGGSVWSTGATNLGSGSVTGSIYAGGAVTTGGAVGGDAFAGGAATIGGGVGGNVVAGTTLNLTNSGSALIGGSAWAGGAASINQTVNGNVIAGGITLNNGGATKIAGNAWSTAGLASSGGPVQGNTVSKSLTLTGGNVGTKAGATSYVQGPASLQDWTTISTNLYAWSKTGNPTPAGGLHLYPGGAGFPTASIPATPSTPSPVSAPGVPTIPGWIHFTYNQSDWTGFGLYTLASDKCSVTGLQAAVDSFGGGKGVVDARACTSPLTLDGGTTVALANDVAIISTKGFSVTAGSGFTTSGPTKLWLITPDTSAASVLPPASCPSGSSITFSGGPSIPTNLTIMSYTPCSVYISSGIHYSGQVFAGTVNVDGAAVMTYTKIGMPGWNLDTGTQSASSGGSNTWTAYSTRNVAG